MNINPKKHPKFGKENKLMGKRNREKEDKIREGNCMGQSQYLKKHR